MAPKHKLCDVCNKTFVDLKIHMRKHTGERPFRCTELDCDRAFAKSGQLRVHMNVHSGLKPYKCRYCPLAFTQGNNRIRHERDHTGEKPFQCKYCDEAFAHPHLFELHERKHTGANTKWIRVRPSKTLTFSLRCPRPKFESYSLFQDVAELGLCVSKSRMVDVRARRNRGAG